MGLGGGLFLATIVFFINFDHGAVNALIAATKQGIYTFLAGGTMMRIAEVNELENDIEDNYATVKTFTYIVHSAKGTPEPFNSTIPTMILAPWGFLWWAIRKRKQLNSLRD